MNRSELCNRIVFRFIIKSNWNISFFFARMSSGERNIRSKKYFYTMKLKNGWKSSSKTQFLWDKFDFLSLEFVKTINHILDWASHIVIFRPMNLIIFFLMATWSETLVEQIVRSLNQLIMFCIIFLKFKQHFLIFYTHLFSF